MNQGDNSASAISRKQNKILPHGAKELKKVSDYVAEKEAEVQKLSDKVTDMGSLGLFWDSKVPEKDETFYYFFSLKVSNRDDVLREVRKYQDFYKELCDAIRNMSNADEQTDEKTNAWEIVEDLKEKLSKISEAAKRGEKDTDSSTVYHLHRSFIHKHETLKYMIKRVECVTLKEGLKKATDGWQESKQAIKKLEEKLDVCLDKMDEKGRKETNDICAELKKENKLLRKNNEEVVETNKRLQQLIEILLEERNNRPS